MLQHSRSVGGGSSRNAAAPCGRAAAARVAARCQPHSKPQQQQRKQPEEVRRPIEVSRSIAAARVAESSRPDRLFDDPWAAALCGMQPPQAAAAAAGEGDQGQQQKEAAVAAAMDVIATRYIDESLAAAMAATSVNTIQGGDYRQVVLLGDGLDSRPFRLTWPPGTLLFAVAPAEVHERAEALLATGQPPAHVQRGCLLRRVDMHLSAATSSNTSSSSSSSGASEGEHQQQQPAPSIFRSALLAAGFRPDRLSVWVLQGLHCQGLGRPALQQLLTEVGDCAAFHSLLVGEVPGPLGRRDADNLLAEAGLLAAVAGHGEADAGEYKRWQELGPAAAAAGAADGDDEGGAERWLCTAQQQRLSLEQMGIYDEWSAEFESADAGDDVIGNFT